MHTLSKQKCYFKPGRVICVAASLPKHLDEPLDEGRFVFECILAGLYYV